MGTDALQLEAMLRSAVFEVAKYLAVLGVGFIVTQVIGYFKLKRQVVKLSGDVKAVSMKFDKLQDKIHDEYIQGILDNSKLKERVGSLEGQMHTFELFYMKDMKDSPNNGGHGH